MDIGDSAMRGLLLIAVMSAGCGSTVCERIAEDQANLQRKMRPCLDPGAQLVRLDVQACEANVEQLCTQAELASIEAGTSCLGGAQVPACIMGKEADFIKAMERCPDVDASDACFFGIFPRR